MRVELLSRSCAPKKHHSVQSPEPRKTDGIQDRAKSYEGQVEASESDLPEPLPGHRDFNEVLSANHSTVPTPAHPPRTRIFKRTEAPSLVQRAPRRGARMRIITHLHKNTSTTLLSDLFALQRKPHMSVLERHQLKLQCLDPLQYGCARSHPCSTPNNGEQVFARTPKGPVAGEFVSQTLADLGQVIINTISDNPYAAGENLRI